MVSDAQFKLLELIASGSLAVTGIFFVALAALFAAIFASGKESERRGVRHSLLVIYFSTLISLALSVFAMFGLRYRTIALYTVSLWAAAMVVFLMLCAATIMVVLGNKGQ